LNLSFAKIAAIDIALAHFFVTKYHVTISWASWSNSQLPKMAVYSFAFQDMRLRNWLFAHWTDTALRYGFEEYDSPVLESESLFIRKAGTEEVVDQLYGFEDKGGRRVALRPELTPSLARMVMARKGKIPMPMKWFSIPQCWRYERMTKGRRREHFQWNMDIWVSF
jgi:histidyl-tRNA synthetase